MKIILIKNRYKRWLRFVLGGGLNTTVTYGIYLLLNLLVNYQLAYLIAYTLGIVFAYWFNTVFVFKTSLSWKAFFSYPLVYVIQYLISSIFLSILIEVWKINKALAPLVITIGIIPLSYLLNKLALRTKG